MADTDTLLTAADVVRILSLAPLPWEGGYFVETYRSPLRMPQGILPEGYPGGRSAATAIFYLLTPDRVSALHRVRGDEIFHFYVGDPVEMLQLREDGNVSIAIIGPDIARGMRPQVVVPGGVWQGCRLVPGGRFALMGTTMAPGFDPRDFELGNRVALIREYPAHAVLIATLTSEGGG
ncbi:MAG TPA: cupin domain-containing protein [Candidatus Binatia bacterium]|nr:cupin domain-containing protein [Candidatus Binatia bacterium]